MLRMTSWKLRREVGCPKTVKQTHTNAENGQLNAKQQAICLSDPSPDTAHKGEKIVQQAVYQEARGGVKDIKV